MEHKNVRELMLSLNEYATVRADSTIQEALEALSNSQLGLTRDRHFHRAVLVLDGDGRVVGKLSHWAILRSLEPELLHHGDEASLSRAGLSEDLIETMRETFTLFAGGLAQMCRAAGNVRAEDAMLPIGESIDESAKLNDAIHLMVSKHAWSIPVTKNGEVTGILRQSDVFEEVARLIRA